MESENESSSPKPQESTSLSPKPHLSSQAPEAPIPPPESLREATPQRSPSSLPMDPASPQRDALLRAPTLDLTPSPVPEVPGWKKQEEEGEDVERDVNSDVKEEEERSRDWTDQVEEEERSGDIEEEKSVEEVSKEEGSKRDRIDRKSETAEEMIEELRRRLAHEAMGSPRSAGCAPWSPAPWLQRVPSWPCTG